MPKLKVNDTEIEFEAGMTVLQVCEQAGVEIPRFCYHERLSIAGNCRMCLVEIKPGPPKPAASCAMPAADGMAVYTDSPMVKKARNGVMEFLLINHPLDCPICDQGGECDLQDQAVAYGRGFNRFDENKRAVEEKYMGPLIGTVMTRCIHCTRCVRFSTEVGGVNEMGLLNRGEHAEITSLEKAVSSELSGNLIDLCPVGALTSKPYAFHARPWELKKTETIDVMDGLGSNIRVDSRANAVLRILPRLNEAVNEEWISDKARFACDGLKSQRLDRPYIRDAQGKLMPASWSDALAKVAEGLKHFQAAKVAAIAGDQVELESLYALKLLLKAHGIHKLECRQDGAKIATKTRTDYLFNSGIAGIEAADALVIVGCNPRHEAAVLNARIRKSWLRGHLKIGVIGQQADLSYQYDYLGAGPASLIALRDGTHRFAEILKKAKKPAIILGSGAVARSDGALIHKMALDLAQDFGMITPDWNGFNLLQRVASRVGAMDIGFTPRSGQDMTRLLAAVRKETVKMVYLLGADEFETSALQNCFVVYQGHHGDAGAQVADVILPGCAYTEKSGTYVNTEGRVQMSRRAVFPPGEAKEDWAIIRALSAYTDFPLAFDDLDTLRRKMRMDFPHLAALDTTPSIQRQVAVTDRSTSMGDMLQAEFVNPILNFYMTDPISRVSETMAACTQEFVRKQQKGTGTDG